jgi:hypothetical protein
MDPQLYKNVGFRRFISIIVVGVVIFIGYFFFQDRKARGEFCSISFAGRILEIESNIKNYKSVKLKDGNWYYLGNYFSYSESQIEVGDSIVKYGYSTRIDLYKRNGQNISCENFHCPIIFFKHK